MGGEVPPNPSRTLAAVITCPSKTLASALCKDMVWFVLMIPIVSHQSMVLLPLTNFNASPVYSTIETPAGMNSQTTACLAKWAMAALPYGIPMLFGGGICVALSRRECSDRDSSSDNFVNAVRFSLGLFDAVLIITRLCRLLCWMFGGSLLGIYFTFGSADVWVDLALVRLFGVTCVANRPETS
jgi:hypothetical protein